MQLLVTFSKYMCRCHHNVVLSPLASEASLYIQNREKDRETAWICINRGEHQQLERGDSS